MTQDPEQMLAIVAGWRTPFCKAGGALAGLAAADLAAHVFRETLDRTGVAPGEIDEVILGCAGPDAREANVARVAALRSGVPERVPAVTVMRNCASGMEAVLAADQRVRAGDGSLFLVGGTESMSNFPLLMGPRLTAWFQRLQKARSLPRRLAALLALRPRMLAPRIAIVEGLTDPITGLMMGNTAENVARLFAIDRAAQDRFALQSHQRAAAARAAGRFRGEIAPLCSPRGEDWLADDDGIRAEQTEAALARLKPVFDRRDGDVTVGNACQVTDGAVAMLCGSLARVRALGLKPLAILRSQARVGLDPKVMGLGPAHAIPAALDRAGLQLQDVDRIEINEAFAAQVLGCQQALASAAWCREHLGRTGAVGEIDPTRLNALGGAIALGHPIAASGARILLSLAAQLRYDGGRYGVASLCIGGGQGQAMVLEAA